MAKRRDKDNPALTYNLDDFIGMRLSDDKTYYNFSLLEKEDKILHVDHDLIDEYMEFLKTVDVPLNRSQYNRYLYRPDLLAYDLYGSTQLDFIILLMNDMVDPKEFCRRTVSLAYASDLSEFLDQVFMVNADYLDQNRFENGIKF